jgi:hypothetical protein
MSSLVVHPHHSITNVGGMRQKGTILLESANLAQLPKNNRGNQFSLTHIETQNSLLTKPPSQREGGLPKVL